MQKPIKTLDEFMDVAAENEVTFRVEATKHGIGYAVGYPHGMSKDQRAMLQEWVDEHREELSDFLFDMAEDIRDGATGTTIITVNHDDDTKH
jgi:hypothetical protein